MTFPTPRALFFTGLVLATASSGVAQPPEARRAADVADELLRCERAHANELSRYTRMLEETRATLLNERTSDAARRDAANAVEVLSGRIRQEAQAIEACTASDTPTQLTASTVEARDVAPMPIGEHVTASAPEKTRGTGALSNDAVLSAVRRLGPPLDACYDAYAERYAIERGQASLVFWTSTTGALSEARFEGLSIGDTTFRSCVARSLRALTSPGPAQGAPVEMRVRLRFGPE